MRERQFLDFLKRSGRGSDLAVVGVLTATTSAVVIFEIISIFVFEVLLAPIYVEVGVGHAWILVFILGCFVHQWVILILTVKVVLILEVIHLG